MVLTRDFRLTIQARAQRDPQFRHALLREGVECLLDGDVETGKAVLRDYINATIGFAELAKVTHHSPKSLMRMLGPGGNPNARNLFAIVACLQQQAGVRLKVHPERLSAGKPIAVKMTLNASRPANRRSPSRRASSGSR